MSRWLDDRAIVMTERFHISNRQHYGLLLKALIAVCVSVCLYGCQSTTTQPMPPLKPCPASPNCVNSDATGALHGIDPLRPTGELTSAWEALISHLERQPNTKIIVRQPDYLAAEYRTRYLRFVDDVEFEQRPAEGVIAMRSASRVGFSDLGVNRRRLEKLRAALAEQGVVQPRYTHST